MWYYIQFIVNFLNQLFVFIQIFLLLLFFYYFMQKFLWIYFDRVNNFLRRRIFGGKNLIIIVSLFKFLNITPFILHNRCVYMFKIIFQHFLLYNSLIVWELLLYAEPVFPFDTIAHKVCVGFVSKSKSFLEAHLETPYYCRISKLLPKSRKVVDFIAYNVPSLVNKKNFIALIKLFSNY